MAFGQTDVKYDGLTIHDICNVCYIICKIIHSIFHTKCTISQRKRAICLLESNLLAMLLNKYHLCDLLSDKVEHVRMMTCGLG